MVEHKRKKNESFESLYRRFTKSLVKSQKLMTARRKQHVAEKNTKLKQQKRALFSIQKKKETEYLKKIGKLKEEPMRK